MKKIIGLYHECRKSDTNFPLLICRYLLFRIRGKNILAHQKAIIKGVKNIQAEGLLKIGISYVGFTHKKDVTFLNVGGRLIANGSCSISRGCRFDIGKDATLKIGAGTYINPFSTFIIMHGLEIGCRCAISWNCQFLDEDFHEINYEGKKEPRDKKIVISDDVWIGCGVSIYKGTSIAKGSVIASNSVVKGVFEEENVLIAGNPARIIKRNISFS